MKRSAFCVYLYPGHGFLYPYEEKFDLSKTFFFIQYLLLYVESTHFLPYTTLVFYKHLYGT